MSKKSSFKKDGKVFGVISIIDILGVVCIIVLALGIYAKYTSDSDAVATAEKTKIEYVYKVQGVRNYTVEALKKGGPVYDSDTKEYAGEVVGVREEESVQSISLVDGTYKTVTVPNNYDVYVTIQVDGKYNSLGLYTNENKYIGAGQTLNAKTKFATTEGEIVEARALDATE